jgi:chloramphenicol O-acetyltransferase type A
MGHFIDLKRWKRREHFQLYRKYSHPFFSLSVEVDATPVWRRCHEPGGPPFFLATVFLMLSAANQTEPMRLRVRGHRVWLHDRVAVGTTVMKRDETFGFARLEHAESFEEFRTRSEAEIARVKNERKLRPAAHKDDLIYHSTLPWLRFTAFTNALRQADSIPRIVFGRCAGEGTSRRMPVAVEAHHALVDGLDVARFLERFETGISSFAG